MKTTLNLNDQLLRHASDRDFERFEGLRPRYL